MCRFWSISTTVTATSRTPCTPFKPTNAWVRARSFSRTRLGPSAAVTWPARRSFQRKPWRPRSGPQWRSGLMPRSSSACAPTRSGLGLDEALPRAERGINAGAEAIFVEAPESVEELERVARSFDVPQFANPLVGGRTPILSPKEFEQARIQRNLLRPRNHHARGQGEEGR